MRTFALSERVLLANLVAECSHAPVSLRHVLQQICFNDKLGQALIVQPAGRFAYFYLHTDVFDDESQREQKVTKLLDFLLLIVYLRQQGLLVIYQRATADRLLLVFSDIFVEPKRRKNAITLNNKGDYTEIPDAIQNADGEVIYKGVKLDGDLYDVLINQIDGVVYASPALRTFALNAAQHRMHAEF